MMPFLLSSLSAVLAATPPSSGPPACAAVTIGATSMKANKWQRDACGYDIKLPAGTNSASIVPTATAAPDLDKKKCELTVDAAGGATVPNAGSDANCDALFYSDVGG